MKRYNVYKSTHSKKITVPIKIIDKGYKINSADLASLRKKSVNYINSTIKNRSNDEYLYFADFSLSKINKQFIELTFDVVLLMPLNKTVGDIVNPSDYWHAFFGNGKCGEVEGEEQGKDATDRLEELLFARPDPASIPLYYSDVTYVEKMYDSEYCFNHTHDYCLSPSEMREYLNKAKEYMYERCILYSFEQVLLITDMGWHNWHQHYWEGWQELVNHLWSLTVTTTILKTHVLLYHIIIKSGKSSSYELLFFFNLLLD